MEKISRQIAALRVTQEEKFVLNKILSDCFRQHIEKSYISFRKICRYYKSGFISLDEACREIQTVFYEDFYGYLKNAGLRTKFDQSTWHRFTEDYRSWQNGTQSCASAGPAWLLKNDYVEAGILEKHSFFELMEDYLVPIDLFIPIPDHCIKPKCRYHSYGALIVTFDLIDDGGLFCDHDPIGKDYILVDDYNLKANLQIERLGKNDEVHNIMSPQFAGSGTIEGYTSSRPHQIYISQMDGRKVWFYLCVENDDYDEREDYEILLFLGYLSVPYVQP